MAGTVVVLGVLLSASLFALPTKSRDLKVELPDHSYVLCRFVEPRWKQAKGLVIYFPEPKENGSLLCHTTLRPLAGLGWKVVSPEALFNQADTGQFLKALSRMYPGQRLFVAGDHEGGRMAWLTALEKQAAMPAAGAGFGFLSSELISVYNGTSKRPAFLIGHNLYDDQASANAALRLQQQITPTSSPLTVRITGGDLSHFSQDWMDWLKAMDEYFSIHR